MASARLTAAFAAHDPARLATFWAAVLGREVVDDDGSFSLPGIEGQLSLRFFPSDRPGGRPNLMHLHLTSTSREDQEATVATVLDLGGRHLDVGQLPEQEHVVVADPEGNEFCVIEPDNAFLTGCGFLGELACDGAREVGLFWSQALGWPLVWDEGDETAIQSPEGGTKVAWGGTPEVGRTWPARQRFELVSGDDIESEVGRLVSLGATHLGSVDGVAALADPGGIAFSLLPT